MLSVQQRFNNASQTYDNVATIQRMCARTLTEKIMAHCPLTPWSSVLDLGTGTGCMAETLLPYLPGSRFTLTDFSPNMLSSAAKKLQHHRNIQYQCANFATHSFDFHELTVSNLALQWVDNWKEVMVKYLKKTRTLAFSCLLAGTFEDWYRLLKEYSPVSSEIVYPSEEAILSFLKTFDVRTVTAIEEYPLSFPNAHVFMRYLKSLGASRSNAEMSLPTLKKILAHSLPIHVKYRVFYGVIQQW